MRQLASDVVASQVWDIPPQPARRPDVPRRLRIGLRIGFAALSFVILIGSGLAWATFQNFQNNIPHGAAVPPLGAGATDADGKDQNILLIGNDSRAGASKAELKALSTGNDGGSVNTDTMMVLHVPGNGNRATIISFPRDSWVSVPGHGKGKINSAYGYGYAAAKAAGKREQTAQSDGIILTIKTINGLTGLHIDHYMQVNLLGFYRISNAIGGVTVCLNAAQNPNTDRDQFGKGYSGIDLPKGVSVIKGTQALAFVRQRHGLPRGDLDRIERQQYFLGAAFRKVTTAGVLLNPFKLHDLLNAVGSSLLIDPKLDLLKLGQQFQAMSAGNITFKTIPNDGPQLIYPDGVETSIVQVDTAAMPAFIRQLQGKAADPGLSGARAAAPSAVTVDVLNGTDTVGLAGKNADQLRVLGFKVNAVDSTTASTDTVIEYPSGKESQAKALSGVVPGAKVVQTNSVDRVTLVLGADNVQVKGLASSKPAHGTPKSTANSKPNPSTPAARTDGLGCIN
jgi:LCP family protein required for cell wall assembly